jgi:hypothetical protein
MSGWKARAAAATLIAAFVAGVLHLFGVQFAAGEVYPAFSSLRTDPLGARLLFDALARLPGTSVSRNFLPPASFAESNAAILMLGVDAGAFVADSEMQVRAERLAGAGNRVVIAMGPPARDAAAPKIGSLYRNWEVKFGLDAGKRLYISTARDWRVLQQSGGRLLAVERAFGKGTIVLMAESYDFANQSTVAADRLEPIAAALGPYSRVVFDEQHFGISETGSIVALARRFRLGGLALGLGLCAALFIWRSASAFPPPAASAAAPDRLYGRTSHAGLLTLLKRYIPAGDAAAVCWKEWLATNRRSVPDERLRAAEAAFAGAAQGPVEALRKIQSVLESKGAS